MARKGKKNGNVVQQTSAVSQGVPQGPGALVASAQLQATQTSHHVPTAGDSSVPDVTNDDYQAPFDGQDAVACTNHRSRQEDTSDEDDVRPSRKRRKTTHPKAVTTECPPSQDSSVPSTSAVIVPADKKGAPNKQSSNWETSRFGTINVTNIKAQIRQLKQVVPLKDHPASKSPSRTHKVVKLRAPHLRVFKEHAPRGGTVYTGGFVHWLRSGSVLPVLKLWYQEVFEDTEMRAQLEEFLPKDDYTWEAQFASLVDLARKDDAGRSTVVSAQDVEYVCAKYARKLFVSNHGVLIANMPDSDSYFQHELLSLPVAALLTAYYDVVTMEEEGFFSKLLSSPLAVPMHKSVRLRLEEDYPLDPSSNYALGDPAIIFEPSTRSMSTESDSEDESVPEDSEDSIDGDHDIDFAAHYEQDPFSAKEELAFLFAYREWATESDSQHAAAGFEIDCHYIAEVMPGRCVKEVHEYFHRNKAALILRPDHHLLSKKRSAKKAGNREDHAEESEANASNKDQPQTLLQIVATSPSGGHDSPKDKVKGQTLAVEDDATERSSLVSGNNFHDAEANDDPGQSTGFQDGTSEDATSEVEDIGVRQDDADRNRLPPDVEAPTPLATVASQANSKTWRPATRDVDDLGTGAQADARRAPTADGVDRMKQSNTKCFASARTTRKSARRG